MGGRAHRTVSDRRHQLQSPVQSQGQPRSVGGMVQGGQQNPGRQRVRERDRRSVDRKRDRRRRRHLQVPRHRFGHGKYS